MFKGNLNLLIPKITAQAEIWIIDPQIGKKYNGFYFKPHNVILRDFALQLLFRAFLIAHSYSVDMAEKNKGSLDMVQAKFGDRNVVTFLPLLRKWKILQIWSIYSKYGQYTHQKTGNWMLSLNLIIKSQYERFWRENHDYQNRGFLAKKQISSVNF